MSSGVLVSVMRTMVVMATSCEWQTVEGSNLAGSALEANLRPAPGLSSRMRWLHDSQSIPLRYRFPKRRVRDSAGCNVSHPRDGSPSASWDLGSGYAASCGMLRDSRISFTTARTSGAGL